MIGGFTGCPVECSTGPGTPMPIATSARWSRPTSARRPCAVSTSHVSTGTGPSATAIGLLRCSRIAPVRSMTATVVCEAPISAARTTRALGLSANCDGGRPPVDAASATGMIRPIRMSSSTRAAIVDRASPVDFASCARVRGPPSRSSWKRSIALLPTGVDSDERVTTIQSITGRDDRKIRRLAGEPTDAASPLRRRRHVARPVGLANRC